jgi:hypothetical protein
MKNFKLNEDNDIPVDSNFKKNLIDFLSKDMNYHDIAYSISKSTYSIKGKKYNKKELIIVYSDPVIENLFIDFFDNEMKRNSSNYYSIYIMLFILWAFDEEGIIPIWTNFKLFAHKNKDIIIKYILKEVYDYVSNGVNNDLYESTKNINILRKFGIDWEEFNVILNSINSNSQHKQLNEEPVDYNHQIWRVNYNIEKNISSKFENKEFIESLTSLHNILLYYPEYRNKLRPYIIEKLINIKPVILKNIFYTIKKYGNFYLANTYIRMLKNIGINWYELDIIKNSAELEKNKQINESNGIEPLSNVGKNSSKECIFDIKHKKVLTGVENLVTIKDTYKISQNEINEELLSVKTIIIKELLERLKKYHFNYVNSTIHYLKMLNQNWPELDIISNSLNEIN